MLDHRVSLAYLAYLGFGANSDQTTPTTAALTILQPRRVERRRGKVTRSVFLCYVLGAAGSGKTTILKAFVGKDLNTVYDPTSKIKDVVNSVEIRGAEKYLVVGLRNISSPALP